jgi:uncharacterized OsmC-like protein
VADDLIVNTVHSSSTHVFGRAINSVGPHHFIIDGSTEPKEEIVPTDAFLAGVSACGVHLIERFARDASVPLDRVEIDITGVRLKSRLEQFDHVDVKVRLHGPSQAQAEDLVTRFTDR